PRLRDRHVHDRREVSAPGLPRRRWPDHQRRDTVDDRGPRHPAHRDAARGPGRLGRLFHGFQLWVNLPGRDKMLAPAYQNLEGDDVTLLSSPDGGTLLRLITGDLGGHHGPGSTHTPITLA